jgi:ABC-2 type transport system ATP-binding protein
VTEKTERPRDAAPAGGPAPAPAPVPGSGAAELDGSGQRPRDSAATASPVVQLAGVSCRRGRREALRQINLEVQPARVTGVLGPNGAGKSTLLGVVAGLYRPFEGTAWVLGEQLPARGAGLRRRIGVVLQETALYEELTVTENLRLTAALYSLARPAQRITEVLELIDLADRAGDRVASLSGGMRRRVTLARALLHHPELLIIDEPTLGIDAEARHAIWEHIRLLRAHGTTVIVASNYLDEVQALCDTAAVLHQGRLVAYEAPESLVSRAGQCLDMDCAADAAAQITDLVLTLPGVSRAEPSASGLTVFLDGDVDPDDVVREVLREAHLNGFRVRAADLAEVFRVLDPAGKGTPGE